MPRDPWQQGVSGGFGGRSAWIGRVLGEGENPLRWGPPLGRVFGVRIRVHWVFVAYVLARVVFTLPRHQAGLAFELPWLGALALLALLHEAAHCVACRRAGGEADEIVLWPLGGLTPCRSPNDWRAELRTTLAGPVLNVALLPVFGAALYAATQSWAVAMPNPLFLDSARLELQRPDGSIPWWLVGLWSLHTANLVLLVFNLAVPMLPLDAGRIVQCLVWRRHGYHRARWVAAHVGLATATGLGAVGLVLADGKPLLLVAVFGAVVCWLERRRLQFLGGVDPLAAPAPRPAAESDTAGPGQAEVDGILEKISRVGMEGLTPTERRVLKRATERSRETQGRAGGTGQ